MPFIGCRSCRSRAGSENCCWVFQELEQWLTRKAQFYINRSFCKSFYTLIRTLLHAMWQHFGFKILDVLKGWVKKKSRTREIPYHLHAGAQITRRPLLYNYLNVETTSASFMWRQKPHLWKCKLIYCLQFHLGCGVWELQYSRWRCWDFMKMSTTTVRRDRHLSQFWNKSGWTHFNL